MIKLNRRFRVKIRRDFSRPVLANAEQIDGKSFNFSYAWFGEKNDPNYWRVIAWDVCEGYIDNGVKHYIDFDTFIRINGFKDEPRPSNREIQTDR